jgi:hypothetical protein
MEALPGAGFGVGSHFVMCKMHGWHFRGTGLARACHFQVDGVVVHSQLSSSGGGLPGRPESKDSDARFIFATRSFDSGAGVPGVLTSPLIR